MVEYTIYIRRGCPYSQNAIKLLKERNEKIKVNDIEKLKKTPSEVVEVLKSNNYIPKKSTHRTVPIIFVNDKFIGGYTELIAFLRV